MDFDRPINRNEMIRVIFLPSYPTWLRIRSDKADFIRCSICKHEIKGDCKREGEGAEKTWH